MRLAPRRAARAHARGRATALAALANALARANARASGPHALTVALAARELWMRRVVAASDAFDPQSRENALAFLQNATVRPAGAAVVARGKAWRRSSDSRGGGAAAQGPGPTPSRRARRTCRRRRRSELYY